MEGRETDTRSVACLFRSTEGRLDNVKMKSGLFPGFQFSLPSMYLGACTLHMLCMRRVLYFSALKMLPKLKGNVVFGAFLRIFFACGRAACGAAYRASARSVTLRAVRRGAATEARNAAKTKCLKNPPPKLTAIQIISNTVLCSNTPPGHMWRVFCYF